MKTATHTQTHTRTGHRHSTANHTHGVVAGSTHLVDDAKALLATTAEAAGARVSMARERLVAAMANGKQKAYAGARATDRTIRANPYQSIAIAAGAAFILGVLFARRGGKGIKN